MTNSNGGIQKMRKEVKWEGKNLTSKTDRKNHKIARQARKNRHVYDEIDQTKTPKKPKH